MYFHKSKYSQLDDLLNRIGEKLQLNSEMKENVSKKYDEVYEVLNKNTDIEGNIYAQGSYALQTTVKPLGRDDFDLDAVVQLDKMWDKTLSAIDLLDNVYMGLLKEYPKAKKKNRCVRVPFTGFHLDIVPAMPYDENDLTKIKVPNTETDYWKESCPKGYIKWFEDQCKMTSVLLEKCSVYNLTQEELTEQVPYEIKPPLKIAVQLAKRYRDVYFKNDEDNTPPSIVLTTLFGLHYDESYSEFNTIKNILKNILKVIQQTDGVLVIYNPSNDDEEITECWKNDEVRYNKFCDFIKSFIEKWNKLEKESDYEKIREILDEMFDENVGQTVVLEQAIYMAEQRRKENLAVSTTGVLTNQKDSSVPVRKNNFFGE